MAQLDFSPLDRRQQILQSQALRSGAVSGVMSDVFDVGKKYFDVNNQRRQEILENSSFDSDLTVDATVNDFYQQKFDETVRRPLIDKLSEKGKFGYIGPRDVNESSLLQQQFERELGLAKNTVNAWNQAKLMQEDPKNFGVYELDQDKWQGFLDIMTGKYKENPSAYMRSIFQGAEVNESPFLKIKAADINSVNNVLLNDAIRKLPSDEEILKNEYQGKGTVVTTSNIKEVLDSSKKELLSDIMLNMVKTGKYGDPRNIAKGAQVSINPNIPQSTNPLSAIAFSIDKKVNDYFQDKDKVVLKTKKTTTTKPVKGKGASSGFTTIKRTDVGADFGSTPISIDKEMTYTDSSGKKRKETFKNASIVSVNFNDKTASIVVPKGKNEEFAKALEDSRKNAGLPEGDRSMDNQFIDALLQTEKYKTVKVPLKDVYNEIKAGFSKKKLYLEGFDDIDFGEEKEKLNW